MANIHSPSQVLKVVEAFCLAITAAATNGASADALGFRRAMAVFGCDASGAGTTGDCKLQESADNATWADVANAAFAQCTTAGGEQVQVMDVDLAKRKRYLRLVFTGAGAAAAGAAYGNIILVNPEEAAVSQANTVVSV